MSRMTRKLFSIAALSLLGLAALVLLAGAPAGAEDYSKQGLKPPAYKYHSQYARKGGLYLNFGDVAYVRIPTIRLRVGSVKYRDVQYANGGGGSFIVGGGHLRPRASSYYYGKQQRIVVPVKTPYYYKPYNSGGPFYGQPSGYVANYYGMGGYGLPDGLPMGAQVTYRSYGFNSAQALQAFPGAQQPQKAYVGGFNKPKQIIGYLPTQPRPKPRTINIADALAKNGQVVNTGQHGALPNVHKPAGQSLIRVQ